MKSPVVLVQLASLALACNNLTPDSRVGSELMMGTDRFPHRGPWAVRLTRPRFTCYPNWGLKLGAGDKISNSYRLLPKKRLVYYFNVSFQVR